MERKGVCDFTDPTRIMHYREISKIASEANDNMSGLVCSTNSAT
jgi:hypothetical protein